MTMCPVFSTWGIELEYMIVDRETLAVRPIADQLLRNAEGEVINELVRGHLGWSNELTLHLIEIKNRTPDRDMTPLAEGFKFEVQEINQRLQSLGARLMPGGMHPWMAPATETRLWPHEYANIYRTYDRIFGCARHGFANLQSMHLNLPFASDAEFTRLHAATRLILPILPALAASSPFAEGRFSGFLDCRMENYRTHQIKVPAAIGTVIPDSVAGIADYHARILDPMYAAIAPYDPENILRHEWLNARGAIPRFERNALEIRVIDMQECPQADLAIAAATGAVVKGIYNALDREHSGIATESLTAVFLDCIRDGDEAIIQDAEYLAVLGFHGLRCQASELWRFLIETHLPQDADYRKHWKHPLNTILGKGPLARRILGRIGRDATHAKQEAAYHELCDCLDEGRMFGS